MPIPPSAIFLFQTNLKPQIENTRQFQHFKTSQKVQLLGEPTAPTSLASASCRAHNLSGASRTCLQPLPSLCLVTPYAPSFSSVLTWKSSLHIFEQWLAFVIFISQSTIKEIIREWMKETPPTR